MSIEEKKLTAPHTLTLDERKRLVVAGVVDVGRFDEQEVILFTTDGSLSVRGSDLHIRKVSLEVGEVLLEGTVEVLQYRDTQPKAKSLLAKVFR